MVQNKPRLPGRLRPTKSRLTRLVKNRNQQFAFLSTKCKNVEEYIVYWACTVYHPETGHKQSLYALLSGKQSLTWTTSLTNDIGRLTQVINKNRPSHKKLRNKYN